MESVQWEDHSTDLFGSLGKLYQNDELIDCMFETHGGLLKGHKAVLAACSPLLKKMFIGHQGMLTISLKKIKYHDLKYILDFIYFGEVDVPLINMASFMKTAQALQIAPLKRFLSPNFSVKFSNGDARKSNNRIASRVNFKKNTEQNLSSQGTRRTSEMEDPLSLPRDNINSCSTHSSAAKSKEINVLNQVSQRENHTGSEVRVTNNSGVEKDVVNKDCGRSGEHENSFSFVAITPMVREMGEQSVACFDSSLENSLEVSSNNIEVVKGRNLEGKRLIETESRIKIEIADMDVSDVDSQYSDNMSLPEVVESSSSAIENLLGDYEISDPQTNRHLSPDKTVSTSHSVGRRSKVFPEPECNISENLFQEKTPVIIDLNNQSGEEQSQNSDNEHPTSRRKQRMLVRHEGEDLLVIEDYHCTKGSSDSNRNRTKTKDAKSVEGNIKIGSNNTGFLEMRRFKRTGSCEEEVQIQNFSLDQESLSSPESLTVFTPQEVVWDVLDANDSPYATSITDAVAEASQGASSSTDAMPSSHDKKVDLLGWIGRSRPKYPHLLHSLRTGSFSDKERRVLVQIVVSAMCEEWGNMYPSRQFKEDVAKAIVEEFPSLASKLPGRSHESFYNGKTGDGYLEYRLKTARINLPSSEKRRGTYHSSSSSKPAKIARQEPRPIPVCPTLPEESLNEKVVEMKTREASSTNKTVIRRLMADTRGNRLQEVRNHKKFANTVTDAVFYKYPHLKSYNGEMIDDEFRFLYPEHADKLLATFSSYFAPRILKIAQAKSTLLVDSLRGIEYNLKALIVLPELLPQPKAGRREAKKSRNCQPRNLYEERVFRSNEPLIPHPCLLKFVPSDVDVNVASEPTANQKQPFLVCVTSDGNSCGPFFIRFDSVLFPVGSNSVAAFDRLFKLQFMLDIEYAQPLLNFYNFIESCVYRGLGTPKCCTDILHTQIINVQLQIDLGN